MQEQRRPSFFALLKQKVFWCQYTGHKISITSLPVHGHANTLKYPFLILYTQLLEDDSCWWVFGWLRMSKNGNFSTNFLETTWLGPTHQGLEGLFLGNKPSYQDWIKGLSKDSLEWLQIGWILQHGRGSKPRYLNWTHPKRFQKKDYRRLLVLSCFHPQKRSKNHKKVPIWFWLTHVCWFSLPRLLRHLPFALRVASHRRLGAADFGGSCAGGEAGAWHRRNWWEKSGDVKG